MLNQIENDYKRQQPYSLYLALFMARSQAELLLLKDIVERAAKEERFKNVAFFVFDKEDVAEMFIGYALMLFEGGVAPEVTDEALEAYKKAFVEAFDYYSVEFIITRAE